MRITLRDKFLIPTMIIFFLGIGVITIISYVTYRNAHEATIKSQILQLAESISTNLSAWIDRNRVDMISLSRQDIFSDAIPDSFMGKAARRAVNPLLSQLNKEYGFYQDIFLADRSGEIIAASTSEMIGQKIAKQPYFYFTIKGTTHTSDVTISEQNGVPVFFISVPIVRNEEVIGVLTGKIDLSYFNSKYVDSVQPGASGYAYIINGDGRVIAHPDKSKILSLDLSRFDYGRKILKTRNGTIQHQIDGMNTIHAIRQEPELNWIVGINAPVEELFSSADRVRSLALITSALVAVLIGVTLTIIITQTVTSPISKFVDSMETVAKGDLDQKITINTADEFSMMAGAFNRMAQSLQESKHQLKITYRRLAQNERMIALGELTARIAHEIKNPLGIIKSSAQILVDPNETQKVKDEVGYFIIDEVNQLSLRIRDLLGHARPMQLMVAPVDLNGVIEERIRFWETQKNNLNSRIVKRCFDKELPLVICDEKLMRQLILNMIINSAEAMREGGCLTIETRAKTDKTSQENGIVIRFADTGTGIAENDLDKIFDPFFTTKENGTGLGLSTVYRIVDKHGGKVSVSSTMAQGTEFRIWLPLKS